MKIRVSDPGESVNVPQWGMLEIKLANTADDSAESVDVSFGAPDGRVVEFHGYQDDGWTVRFMPDTTGEWSFQANLPGGRVEGAFTCVDSDIPGLVEACASNPTWFGYRGGEAFVPRCFHVGDCFFSDRPNTVTGAEWSPEMRTAFLDWAQGQGYNMLSIASHYLNRRSEDRGEGWVTPDLWDHEANQPRPGEYAKMEAVLDDLADHGMIVYPFAGMFGRDANFPTAPEDQDRYIRYTLARLAPYWNILLMVGGPEPHLKNKRYLSDDEINRIGRSIRDNDPFGHLLSVHNPTGDDSFRQEDWVSYVILQGPKTVDREQLRDDQLRNRHPEKPLYAQETLWPGNILHRNRIGHDYSLDDIRKNGFVMLFSGAAINVADMDGLSSSGFSGRPDLALKKQPVHDVIRRVWDLFESLPYQRTAPAPDLVDMGHCLSGEGILIVYLESSGSVRPNVEGEWSGEWINVQDAGDRHPVAVREGGTLDTPSGGEDWILVLRSGT